MKYRYRFNGKYISVKKVMDTVYLSTSQWLYTSTLITFLCQYHDVSDAFDLFCIGLVLFSCDLM